jgi:cytidylate kinase
MNDKKVIFNVGRQLGSGGHDIGRMLALDFNAHYYDRELLNLAARESGLSERSFEQNDEHKRFIRGFLHLPGMFGANASYARQGFTQDSFFQFQSDAIRKAAQDGNCVFVGRCADYVLRDMEGVVNIFITADIEFRNTQVMSKQSLASRQEARRFIEQGEARRAEYYNYYTGKRWGHATSYDLCIDSSILGLVETEKFIVEFVKKKFAL